MNQQIESVEIWIDGKVIPYTLAYVVIRTPSNHRIDVSVNNPDDMPQMIASLVESGDIRDSKLIRFSDLAKLIAE